LRAAALTLRVIGAAEAADAGFIDSED